MIIQLALLLKSVHKRTVCLDSEIIGKGNFHFKFKSVCGFLCFRREKIKRNQLISSNEVSEPIQLKWIDANN